MDFQIPLNRLKFGQDAGAGINARTAGRLDGIEALAANIFAQSRTDKLKPRKGLIENLIVKPLDDGFFGVSNGNRRLAALHQIHGADSDEQIPCTSHEVDDAAALEQSLITAVTARQLHPVDQYENFARLKERKTHEEIAQQYGLSEKEVRQALALGDLSPKIRDAWRRGEIKAEVARAFTLGTSHKIQDKAFAKLEKAGHLYEGNIKRELGASDREVAELLGFVGADVYRNAGGEVVEDLFGESHVVSKPDLLKQLAADKLSKTCLDLRGEGWSWAELMSDLPQGARWWQKSTPKALVYEGDEEARLTELRAQMATIEKRWLDDDDENFDYEAREAANAPLLQEVSEIEARVARRSFTDRQKAKAGCIVILDDGALDIMFGVIRPAEVASAGKKASAANANDAGTAAEEAAPEPAISQSLLQQLSIQFTEAAALALSQDVELSLIVLLARLASDHDPCVKVAVSGLGAAELDLTGVRDVSDNIRLLRGMKVQDRMSLLAPIAAASLDFRGRSLAERDGYYNSAIAVCDQLDPQSLNAALRGAFDAKAYFDGVAKGLALQAIEEALGPDIARQQGKKGKPDLAAFALENVPPTGWLPVQLRAKGYDGPPVVKAAPAVEAPAPMKKAAAAKKVVKKTSAKPAAGKPAKKAPAKKAAKPAAKKTGKKPAAKKRKA
jgi:ParB family chromosome partitioning protein